MRSSRRRESRSTESCITRFIDWRTGHDPCLFGEIQENNAGRIADRYVLARKREAACFAIHAKDSDIVPALIATIEELAGGVEIEAARIAAARPLFPDVLQRAVLA